MVDSSPATAQSSSLVNAASIAVLALAVLGGIPFAVGGWDTLSMARDRDALRASHLAEAARHVRASAYTLAAIGYKRAGATAAADPGVSQAADHLLVLSAIRYPGRLTGQLLNETEYVVERALRQPTAPPHREYYLAARGAVLAIRGRVDEALAAFEDAVKAKPDFAPARYFRGKVLADIGRPDDAVPELDKAIELEPGNGFALKRLARVHLGAGRLDQAAELLQRAIDLGSDADAQFQMGLVRDRQRKHEDALRHFVAAGRIQPEYPNLSRNLGLTLFKLKRWQESAQVLNRVFEQTRDIDIYYYIGRSLMELGDRQKAANIFKTIVDNRPNHADARYDLARLLDQAGQHDRARGHYMAFVRSAESRPDLAAQVRFAKQRLEALREVLSQQGPLKGAKKAKDRR